MSVNFAEMRKTGILAWNSRTSSQFKTRLAGRLHVHVGGAQKTLRLVGRLN